MLWREGGKWENVDLEDDRMIYDRVLSKGHTCTHLGNGELLLIGGIGPNNEYKPCPREFDVEEDFFYDEIFAVEFEKAFHTATLVKG